MQVRVPCILAIGLLTQAVLQQPLRAQSASKVEGIVLESGADRPLERAQVLLLTGSEPAYNFGASPAAIAKATTDAQGQFSIEAKPGRYRIVPILEGFVHAPSARVRTAREPGVWVQVLEKQRTPNVQLRMVREGVISGRVLDTNGRPPAVSTLPAVGRQTSTATVTILQYQYNEYGKRELQPVSGLSYPGSAYSFVRPDDRGDFRLYGLQPGDYYLRVSSGGPIGARQNTYYPGAVDEANAAPIHVGAGEEANIGTIIIPSQQVKSVQVRLRFPVVEGVSSREIRFGDGGGILQSSWGRFTGAPHLETEMPLQVAPGHYDAMVTARSSDYSILEGAAYRNADFLKAFEERGKPIRIEKDAHITTDIVIAAGAESGEK